MSMSSTLKLNNKTNTAYRLNTKTVINIDNAVPWHRETYFIKNIVISPNKEEDVVEFNREEHITNGKTYILRTIITNRNNQVLCSVWIKMLGTLLSSDVEAKVDDSTGQNSTDWQKGKGNIDTTLDGQDYNISFYWVSQSLSLFDNLEVIITKL